MTLVVMITRAHYFRIDFATGSEIYDSSGCNHDRLVFTAPVAWTVCGSGMDKLSRQYFVAFPETLFTATFLSDSGDGNKVAHGFEMILEGEVYLPFYWHHVIQYYVPQHGWTVCD
ncbi:uncharacterized protein LOC143034690 [Oratosquilla oratoria]|uniref:uncharacterized protein LOC143034690 n=1 Tax=Oratosquilla oratoria TaxID=337810 RepID=UPI003F76D7ED